MLNQKSIEEWRELMEKFVEVGLPELINLLGTQKEFESGCIPRKNSLEMSKEGESIIMNWANPFYQKWLSENKPTNIYEFRRIIPKRKNRRK